MGIEAMLVDEKLVPDSDDIVLVNGIIFLCEDNHEELNNKPLEVKSVGNFWGKNVEILTGNTFDSSNFSVMGDKIYFLEGETLRCYWKGDVGGVDLQELINQTGEPRKFRSRSGVDSYCVGNDGKLLYVEFSNGHIIQVNTNFEVKKLTRYKENSLGYSIERERKYFIASGEWSWDEFREGAHVGTISLEKGKCFERVEAMAEYLTEGKTDRDIFGMGFSDGQALYGISFRGNIWQIKRGISKPICKINIEYDEDCLDGSISTAHNGTEGVIVSDEIHLFSQGQRVGGGKLRTKTGNVYGAALDNTHLYLLLKEGKMQRYYLLR